jgi:ABC-type spermidine/putrescine transport system permease subunit II
MRAIWRRAVHRVVASASHIDHPFALDVASPPIMLGVAMWLLFAFPLRHVPFGEFGWFGTRAQLVGLVTLFLPLATLIVFARLVLIDRDQEEMAADLGASPNETVKRVLLPQLRSVIAASAAVVFAGALGEFVIVDAVRGSNATRALGPAMFGSIGGATPRHSVIGTTLALTGAVAFGLLVVAFRSVFSRGSIFRQGVCVALYATGALGYGSVAMMYRVELLLEANVDDETLHEILVRANTYAIVEEINATRDDGDERYLFTGRVDAPNPEAALGTILTVLAQTSGHVGLVEEGSLRRVVIEREEARSD